MNKLTYWIWQICENCMQMINVDSILFIIIGSTISGIMIKPPFFQIHKLRSDFSKNLIFVIESL